MFWNGWRQPDAYEFVGKLSKGILEHSTKVIFLTRERRCAFRTLPFWLRQVQALPTQLLSNWFPADNTALLSPGTKTPRRCLEMVLSALQEHPIEISLDFLRYITQPQFSHEEIDLLWNKAEIIWSSSRVLFLESDRLFSQFYATGKYSDCSFYCCAEREKQKLFGYVSRGLHWQKLI